MEYTEKDLVKIAKRENNTKRNYLVVDPLQGKHIPVVPSKALDLFAALADTFREKYKDEKLLLVGFAETATAIGAQAAITVGADYIQTTREVIPGVNYLFFSEEHSHATEQKLVKDDIDRAAAETDRIIFIEDEVTTGKTIRNIISILDREYDGKFKYSVASLLNGMSEENLERYKRQGISLYYLVKTDHSTYGDRAETFKEDGFYYKCPDKAAEYTTIYVKNRMDARRLIDSGKLNVTVLSRNTAGFSGIRIRFLPVRFPRRNTSPAAFAGRPSPRRASTADNIIITAISAAISTLFSAVRPLTLKAVRSHP